MSMHASCVQLGVEVYTGQGGIEVLYNETGEVCGVATNDVGVAKDGSPKESAAASLKACSLPLVTLRISMVLLASGRSHALHELHPDYQESFQRGMELRAKATLFAEGCRGSLTKEVFSVFMSHRRERHVNTRK